MSKGSKQRPTNQEKYNDGWERIFGKRADREGEASDTTTTSGSTGKRSNRDKKEVDI